MHDMPMHSRTRRRPGRPAAQSLASSLLLWQAGTAARRFVRRVASTSGRRSTGGFAAAGAEEPLLALEERSAAVAAGQDHLGTAQEVMAAKALRPPTWLSVHAIAAMLVDQFNLYGPMREWDTRQPARSILPAHICSCRARSGHVCAHPHILCAVGAVLCVLPASLGRALLAGRPASVSVASRSHPPLPAPSPYVVGPSRRYYAGTLVGEPQHTGKEGTGGLIL